MFFHLFFICLVLPSNVDSKGIITFLTVDFFDHDT